jgi:hypothetical protein
VSDLDQLAADLTYAAGQGAEELRAQLTHGAAMQSSIGVALPGSGLITKHRGHASAADVASNPVALAEKMATRAADRGAELVVKGKS